MDRIDEKNFRDKVARSIIKRWNIHYVSKDELALEEKAKEMKLAAEVYERLQQEASQKKESMRDEIERALKEQERSELYNPTTGAYSGEYGRDVPGDRAKQEQIDRILAEKDESLYHTIEAQKEQS